MRGLTGPPDYRHRRWSGLDMDTLSLRGYRRGKEGIGASPTNALLALRCTIKSGRDESLWERNARQWAA